MLKFLLIGSVVATLAAPAWPQAAANSGQAIFKSHCALCHGADATGNTTMGKQMNAPDLHSDEVQNLSAAEMTTIVSDGKDPMPSFQDQLSKDEITMVVKYVRSLKKTKK